MQSVHGSVQCGVHGELDGFIRVGEVSRIASSVRETLVEFDSFFLIRTRCGFTRSFVPEDDGLAVAFLDVRRCAVVEGGVRGATIMRSVNWP